MESQLAEKKHHILYVDDEEHNLTSFRAAFRRYYHIHTANSAKDGIEILKSNSIHLIITDQRMPEMTGVQFLEKLIPDYPDIIRMILTGFSDVEDIIKAINTGRVYRYITKPWDENELKMSIDLALDSYELRINNAKLNEEIRQRELKLRSILDNTSDLISILDTEGNYKYLNPAHRTVMGYEYGELISTSPFNLIHQDDLEAVKKLFNEGLAYPGSVKMLEYRIRHKNGDWILMESKGAFMQNADDLGGIIISTRDITERKRNQELERDKELAEESTRLKQQFLANMSHEIRTPMNAVIGMTRLVLQTELTPTQLKYMSAIRQASENLLVVINDILDFSKIEAGKLEFEAIDFKLSGVFEGLVNTLRFKAEEKSLNLVAEMESGLPEFLVGDPVRLSQILLNLAGNAIKFTEKGSVTISCKGLDNNGSSVTLEFSVTDTGIGIAEDKLSSIFDSFSQASSDTTRKYGGTGLGLTISKQLVELQGGTIDIKSAIGEGTTFYFKIPFKIGKGIKEQIKDTATLAETLENVNILLVEDNQFNQMVAIDTLESLIKDVKIEVAENGKVAIELIEDKMKNGLPDGKKFPYDIILMDVQMPVMNGYDATSHIRNELNSPLNEIPIMAMTANATKDEVERCFASGMDEYISKPFDVDDLLGKISKFVTKSDFGK